MWPFLIPEVIFPTSICLPDHLPQSYCETRSGDLWYHHRPLTFCANRYPIEMPRVFKMLSSASHISRWQAEIGSSGLGMVGLKMEKRKGGCVDMLFDRNMYWGVWPDKYQFGFAYYIMKAFVKFKYKAEKYLFATVLFHSAGIVKDCLVKYYGSAK